MVIGDIETYDVWLTDALRGDIAIKDGLTTVLKRQAPKLWRLSNKHLVSEFELAAPLYAVRLQEGRLNRSLTSAFTQRNTAILNQFPSYRFTAIYRPLRRRYLAKKHSLHQ